MAVTLTTSDECYHDALGTDVDPSTNTLPTSEAIDGYRSTAYNRIKRITGLSAVSDDVDGIAKGVELEAVSEKIRSVVFNYSFSISTFIDSQKEKLWDAFTSEEPTFYAFIPNQNG
jgi:hypothetical protein